MDEIKQRFSLSSEECELLLEFESTPSLQGLALRMGRDHSVVARTLKKIADKYPVVEKKSGRWVITEMGRQLNDCSRAALAHQSSILASQSVLRIGTNREFSARVLALDMAIIQSLFPSTDLHIKSYELGTESAILGGLVDIGLDCDRPNDPEISYKLIVDEPIVVVASKVFAKKYKKKISTGEYHLLPHLFCERLNPDVIISSGENQFRTAIRFNDISSARAACVQGLGWALLPRYAVLEEIESGKLVLIDERTFGKARYGVWWPRGRSYLKPSVEKLIGWLQMKIL